MKWTLQQIAEWSQGQIISTHQTEFSEFSTDTRKPCDKKVFIALKGDQFDAHDFLDQAAAQGAGLLLVHRMDPRFDTLKNKISIIKVDDTLSALQSWAKHYCKTLRAQVFAITGSNGKTTTKEFLAKILNVIVIKVSKKKIYNIFSLTEIHLFTYDKNHSLAYIVYSV